jgi:hypothetical protein
LPAPTHDTLSGSSLIRATSAHRHHAKRHDPIIDGVLKGVALALVGPLLCGPTPSTRGQILLGALTFGALGGLIDAMHSRNRAIIEPRPFTPAVRWRISF